MAGMTTYQVIEGRRYHCGQMARQMRFPQRVVVEKAGRDPHRNLADLFDASFFCRAWLIDGKLAALGGLEGGLLNRTANVWAVFSPLATRHRVALVREARRQLAAVDRELLTPIALADKPAQRLAAFLGFHIAHEGDGAPAETQGERRALIAAIGRNTDRRVTVGASDFVVMGWHRCA